MTNERNYYLRSPPASPAKPQPKNKKDTRSSITKEAQKLKKISLKEWNKLVRNKQFSWNDGIRTKIIKIRTQGKKFLDWIVETKDIQDGDLGEIEFESMLKLAKTKTGLKNDSKNLEKKSFKILRKGEKKNNNF